MRFKIKGCVLECDCWCHADAEVSMWLLVGKHILEVDFLFGLDNRVNETVPIKYISQTQTISFWRGGGIFWSTKLFFSSLKCAWFFFGGIACARIFCSTQTQLDIRKHFLDLFPFVPFLYACFFFQHRNLEIAQALPLPHSTFLPLFLSQWTALPSIVGICRRPHTCLRWHEW